MQFDALTQRALTALAPQVDRYQTAVAQALQAVREYLAARRHQRLECRPQAGLAAQRRMRATYAGAAEKARRGAAARVARVLGVAVPRRHLFLFDAETEERVN